MKRSRSIFVIATVIAAAVSLTACSNSSLRPYVNANNIYATISLNTDTGKITKYVDNKQKVQFNDGPTADNIRFKSSMINIGQSMSMSLYSGNVVVDGKPYTVDAAPRMTFTGSIPEMVKFYNQNVAYPSENGHYALETEPLMWQINSYINSRFIERVITHEIPAIQYTPTGENTVATNTKVQRLWNEGVSARTAYDVLHDNNTHQVLYDYYFGCATYDITSDTTAFKAATKKIFDPMHVEIVISTPSKVENVATKQPCEVVDPSSPETPPAPPTE